MDFVYWFIAPQYMIINIYICMYLVSGDWNMNFMTFHSIWDVILPIDFHIFQRG